MTATVNASTSAGVIVTSDTSGALALQTAGTTALSISSAQAITVNGLITSTVGNSGFILRGSTATNSYIYPVYVTNTSGGVQLALEGASGGNVLVGGTAYATVLTTTTNTPVEIGINTTRVGSFSSTGLSMVKSIGVGNTTPSSSGSGIAFPATQSASSDANTLDDYEEGTWTPTDYSGAGLTFTGIAAAYTKIGRQVFVNGTVTFPSTASTAAANLGSLPFPYGSGTDYTQQGSPIRNNASLSIQPFGLNAGVSNFVFLIIGQYTNYASNLQMSGSTVGFSFNYYTT